MPPEINQPIRSPVATGNDDLAHDELLHVDRAVRRGLEVPDGETILTVARRIVSEKPLERFSRKKLEAAHALIDADHSPVSRWAAMKHAAAILTAIVVALATWGCTSGQGPINVITDGSLHLPAVQIYTFYVDSDVSFNGNLD